MKKLLLTLLVALLGFTASSQITNTNACVTFVWDQPGAWPDAWCLYHSTNSATPLTNWVKIATLPFNPAYRNSAVGGYTNDVFVPAGDHFFYLTASNHLGETLPSNIIGTGDLGLLLKPTNLRAEFRYYTQ